MLISLSIRNVVLIDSLDLSFDKGLSVFTGETGAGKSILLDSLNLSLGVRADSGLVRHGADKLSVTAEFSIDENHSSRKILKEHDLDTEDETLILRRVVNSDGRSKAFVNDQPVSIGILRTLGNTLIEIHGQFERHSLINPATHCGVLDKYGELDGLIEECRTSWNSWQVKIKQKETAENALSKAGEEEDFLRHAVEELEKFAPKVGEDKELTQQRNMLMHGEKLIEGMNLAYNVLTADKDADSHIREAMSHLVRIAEMAEGKVNSVMDALDRAVVELDEAVSLLEQISGEVDLDPHHLEDVEDRLFSMRAIARKHNVETDELPNLLEEFTNRLTALDNSEDEIIRLAKEEETARLKYTESAQNLSQARKKTAIKMDGVIVSELPPLKLNNAVFVTKIETKNQTEWSENGIDNVIFTVATNKGTPPAPLHKIASGGELSRFMLALKVILSKTSPIPCLVFDEVDSDIGGATAAAVGKRLALLAKTMQVLVITHSPQVAALGNKHMYVKKQEQEHSTLTSITILDTDSREKEIARMLAGATITTEALAAARSLLKT